MITKDYFTTYTGIKFYFKNPDISMFDIKDVARALSLINRFQGHTKRPYSVGEHSLRCAEHVVSKEEQLDVLIHDFAEAYYGDIPSPVKVSLSKDYSVLEDNWLRQIYLFLTGRERTNIPETLRRIDYKMCCTESRDLTNHDKWWMDEDCYDEVITDKEIHWKTIERRLLEKIQELT